MLEYKKNTLIEFFQMFSAISGDKTIKIREG